MRLKYLYPALIFTAAMIFAACNAIDTTVKSHSQNANASPEVLTSDNAPRVTTAELETLMKEGKAYVIDVRSQDSYDMGHIPGSRLIPANEILNHVNELPRDKQIIAYCS
ncbi:MAG TPA: rhodanese-like domain-containing protein [Pyrinomonadaceae bacterium]|jgi:3-mercaptopyruvate sulfurtransferase SseA|nr:rhodanese-like domain-containing protein [Pyrinomonadaceae bacterium]